MLLWLRSVCWARTLDTPKWDILATDAAVYFESKLRKLKLQTYQSISPAKVREKPPDNAKNRENGEWGRENSLHLLRKLHKLEGEPHLAISMSRMTETLATKYWV